MKSMCCLVKDLSTFLVVGKTSLVGKKLVRKCLKLSSWCLRENTYHLSAVESFASGRGFSFVPLQMEQVG